MKKKEIGYNDTVEILDGISPGDKAIIRRRKRKVSLKRALGLPGIVSIAYGNMSSSMYFALGVTASYALGATPFVFMMAALFFVFTALAYAEGTAAIPEAGGTSSFARKGFNEMVSFIAGWCLLLSYVAAIALSAFAAVNYLGSIGPFAALQHKPWNILGAGALLMFLMVINMMGIRASSALNVLLAAVDLVTQFFLVIVGTIFLLSIPRLISNVHWGIAPTWSQLAMSIFLVMVSLTGIENISNMAEESKSPETTIPRSMWMSVGLILILFVGLSMVALSAMPAKYQVEGYAYSLGSGVSGELEENERFPKIIYYKRVDKDSAGEPVVKAMVSVGRIRAFTDNKGYFKLPGIGFGERILRITKPGYLPDEIIFDTSKKESTVVRGHWTTELAEQWQNNPVLGIADKLPIFSEPMGVWISILAFSILIVAANANLLGVSRLVFSMATYRQIPGVLAQVHPSSRTPYMAVVVFTIVAFLMIIPGNLELMAQVYAFAAMISYTIAHVSIIALRVKRPDMNRPYKIPLNINISGKQIPITSILGAIACFSIWVVVSIKHIYGRTIGIPFIIIGVIIYFLYRHANGLSLTETAESEIRK